MGKTILQTKNLTKMFNDTDGISDLSIEVEEGSFVSLLGPSGCGKTTTLNLLGGFLFCDTGSIFIDGKDVTKLEPQLRPCATVFQSYALFPQMTVEDNVAFGLRYGQRLTSSKATKIAAETLEKVGLEGYRKSYIQELSGGQQQRVAIARALATSPRILLLDEPLSNLDAKLRISLRQELKELQRQVGITMIYVTHDQQEALELSDEIFLLHKARLVQHGSPSDIYFKPQSSYAASFIGQANILSQENTSYVIRPEAIGIKQNDRGSFVVSDISFTGPATYLTLSYRPQGEALKIFSKDKPEQDIAKLLQPGKTLIAQVISMGSEIKIGMKVDIEINRVHILTD